MEFITINAFNKISMDQCIASGWNLMLANALTTPTSEGCRNLIKDFGQLLSEKIKTCCATCSHKPLQYTL